MHNIITPQLFYLANFLDTMKVVTLIASIITFIIWSFYGISFEYKKHFSSNKHSPYKKYEFKKPFIISEILFILFMILTITLPDRQTFYQMIIASQVKDATDIADIERIIYKIVEASEKISNTF